MMAQSTIDRLIINTPYEEPTRHWRYERETRLFSLMEGRRPAGYVVASESSKAFDDPGIFIEIPLVNQIRPRIKAWREAGYQGVSSITKRLLEHWQDPEEFEGRRFFFCQLEAVETLIWLIEAPAAERVGIEIPGDGGTFVRQCCKMATGSGKTIVMAMVIAWHILNKVTYPQDARFSRNVLVMAPGLTVKSRLAVLEPSAEGNYYEAFRIVPAGLLDKLRQGKVLIRNWHVLSWDSEEQIKKRGSVDKRGGKSDEAYTREVLQEMANAQNLLVINEEAHHAWRINPDAEGKYLRSRDLKDSAEEATVWIGGLDRIHRTRGILKCYDFSATPFTPSGKKSPEEALFGWIGSDFGLNDAIESGLVKTPRVVVRDDAVPDAKTYKSRLYHIYNDPDVKDDLNRRAKPEEPLPDLVLNAYYLLGYDWREAYRAWEKAGLPTPPVMITVCNRTETAARVKHAFRPTLTLDWSKVQPMTLDAAQTAQVAELAPILEGKPDVTQVSRIELERLAREFRTQRIIFETARDVFDQMKRDWPGNKEVLLAQLVRLLGQFIRSDKIAITPPLFYQDELPRRLIITLNMSRVVQHTWEALRYENTERLEPIFDSDHPIRSTGDMRTCYTGKPWERTRRSHINVCVYDSTWEASDAFALDDSDTVAAWAKNDHLGFEVLYVYRGVVRKYRPDFLVRLLSGDILILETKGQDTEQDRVKRRYLDEWTQAVNAHGGFGRWNWAVAHHPGEIKDILLKHATSRVDKRNG